MKKSLIALLLTLALVVTVSVFAVSANNGTATTTPNYTLTIADGVATAACPCSEHKGATATFTAWTAMPTAAGHFYLADNYTYASQAAFPAGNVVLHLNGNTYQRTGQGAAIAAYKNANITILDNPANAGGIKDRNVAGSANTWGGNGGIIQIGNANTTLNIYGGTYSISETAREVNGGIIGLYSDNSVVNIYGGVYEGVANFKDTTNKKYGQGGAFYVSNGTLNIYGGLIQNCQAYTGGAIYVSGAKARLNIEGGTFSNCSASNGAGAIYIQYQSANNTFSGGTIKNCSAPNGGAIYLAGSGGAKLTMSGTAKIQNCSATTGSGGAVYIMGSSSDQANPAHFEIQGGEISECTALKGAGGFVYLNTDSKVTMTGGLVKDCSSLNGGGSVRFNSGRSIFNMSGGEIRGGSCTGTADTIRGGNFMLNVAAKLNITGGKITNGEAPTGGNMAFTVAPAAGSVIKNLEVSGGTAKNGGNIVLEIPVAFENCKITDGTAVNMTTSVNASTGVKSYAEAKGGNIAILAAGAGSSFTGCEITGGIAGATGEDGKIFKEVYTNEVSSKEETAYSNGRGGNVAVLGAATFTNCVVRNGKSYANNPCGGNFYINGTIGTDKQVTLDGCTITGGYAHYSGGNIQHHAAGTVVITGDSYIAEGKAGTMGGNIQLGVNANAVLKIEGDTEINSQNSSASGNNGVNIHVASTQQLYLGENARIVSDKSQHSIAVAGAGTVHLSGNAFMNSYIALYAAGHNVDETKNYAAGRVIAEEGFTGDVLLLTYYKNITGGTNQGNYDTVENWAVGGDTVNFGAEAPAYLQAGENYANTGTIKVHSKGRSGYVTVYDGTKFIIAPYTAFVPMNNDAEEVLSSHVEVGLANFDTLPANTGYVKLYSGADLTLNENLNGMPIDLNNQVVTIDTNGYTLAPIDYRTDGGVVAAKTKLTVEGDESKVQLLVNNPLTGYNYLNVKDEETGTWTSNCVRVSLKKVNLRPSMKCTDPDHGTDATCCGIYYTAKITANSIASAKILDYGIVAGLNLDDEQIPANFMENGNSWWRWTCKGVEPGTVFYDANTKSGLEFNGGMVGDIMCTGVAANATRGAAGIAAKAYATAKIGDQEIKIISDEQASVSVRDLADKLAEMHDDADATTKAKIEAFLNGDFVDAMKTWVNVAENLAKFYAA